MERKDLPIREQRRIRDAMPPTSEPGPMGCIGWILPWLAGCVLFGWQFESWWFPTIAALPALVVLATVLQQELAQRWLVWRARRHLLSRGVRFVVVYSDSAKWHDYIVEHWLPRFGERAVVLNWSQRAQWPKSLEARLFDTFVKRHRNYNPAVIVLRERGKPLVFRFYYAFKQVRAGRDRYLKALEQELFGHLQS